MRSHSDWLQKLQELTLGFGDVSSMYLWPRTPIANLQAEIWRRCGVSDMRADLHNSRPGKIIDTFRDMQKNHLLRSDFNLLDICCGDAVVLWQIKNFFQECYAYGVDIQAKEYDFHSTAIGSGVEIYKVLVQCLVKNAPPFPFDVTIMLNTYRGWDSADLKGDDLLLPYMVDEWLYNNTRYTILTATSSQISKLKRRGFWVWEIGSGEDDSTMIGMFPGNMESM